MPPESLKENRYSFKSDIWSLGVIAFEMVYGHLPWKEKIETVLFDKIKSTPVQELFEPDVIVSQHYKDFMVACLQTDYDQRASPEWVINYEWPLASEHVDGVDSADLKSVPLTKMQSGGPPVVPTSNTAHFIEEEKQERTHRRIHHQVSLPTPQQRDKSPTSKHEFIFNNFLDEPPKYKTIIAEPARPYEPIVSEGQFTTRPLETPRSRGESGDPELCIMSQVHYCRFLGRLFEAVEAARGLPEQAQLKSDIASLIIAKSEMLFRISQGENLLNL